MLRFLLNIEANLKSKQISIDNEHDKRTFCNREI
jgi:hypothetical protein